MQCPIHGAGQSDILLEYCDRKLSVKATAEFERHIASCEACREFIAAQRLVWSALDTWEAIPPSDDFDTRLYQRIEQHGIQQHERGAWWKRILVHGAKPLGWKVAIPSVCVTVIAAVLLYAPVNGPVVPVHETSRMETFEPEQVEQTLEDLEMLKQLSAAGSQSL